MTAAEIIKQCGRIAREAATRKLFPKCTCRSSMSDCPVHPRVDYTQTYNIILDELEYEDEIPVFPDAQEWLNDF